MFDVAAGDRHGELLSLQNKVSMELLFCDLPNGVRQLQAPVLIARGAHGLYTHVSIYDTSKYMYIVCSYVHIVLKLCIAWRETAHSHFYI